MMQIRIQSRVATSAAAIFLLLAAMAAVWFGLRTYASFRLLQSAQAIGQPHVSSLRGWMTLGYVAETYHAPLAALASGLGLPAETPAATSLKSLADRQGTTPFDYVRRVQQVLGTILPQQPREGPAKAGARDGMMDWIVSSLLTYHYPALALVLFFGALGVPLPTGLSAALAGSLIALGHMNWLIAAATAIAASVVGDAGGYGIGQLIGERVLTRHGRWVGYTHKRHQQVGALFARWGGLSILLTRTLVSSLSSLVNLFAGASGYRLSVFIAFAVLGRLVWTSAYVGLGYVIAGDVEAAAEFLENLTGLLVFLAIVAALILFLAKPANPAPRPTE